MSVTAFQVLPLADRVRQWDGAATENRVRQVGACHRQPNEKYLDAHVGYDSGEDNVIAYKLLIVDVIDRVKRHLGKYCAKMDDTPSWQRD
jgi:hypothetical protein